MRAVHFFRLSALRCLRDRRDVENVVDEIEGPAEAWDTLARDRADTYGRAFTRRPRRYIVRVGSFLSRGGARNGPTSDDAFSGYRRVDFRMNARIVVVIDDAGGGKVIPGESIDTDDTPSTFPAAEAGNFNSKSRQCLLAVCFEAREREREKSQGARSVRFRVDFTRTERDSSPSVFHESPPNRRVIKLSA